MSKGNWGICVAVAAVSAVVAFGGRMANAAPPDLLNAPPVMIDGHEASAYDLLVQFRPGKTIDAIRASLAEEGLSVFGLQKFRMIDWYRATVSTSYPLADTLALLNAQPDVVRAEPNYIGYLMAVPDDPFYATQWGMTNINAPAAWDVRTDASSVLVAVIDDGVDYTHVDLQGQFWVNPGEVPGNGVDDDLDGYVDDYMGWDFAYNDNDPQEGVGSVHGTHITGTIAAVGNNGKGVAGVCWTAKIMPLRFIREGDRSGTVADVINAIEYATMHGAKVINLSWGTTAYSGALQDILYVTDSRGVLFVAAAGDGNSNNDTTPLYPASFPNPNIMSVAASSQNDTLVSLDTTPPPPFYPFGSNHGTTSVDIAAPGIGIESTVPTNGYASQNGTLTAAAHVTGAAALVWAQYPYLTAQQVRERILTTVRIPLATPEGEVPISSSVASKGILDVGKALSDYYSIVTPSPLPPGISGEPYDVVIETVPELLPLDTASPPTGLTLDADVDGYYHLHGIPNYPTSPTTATFTVNITGSSPLVSRTYVMTIEAGNTIWVQVHSAKTDGSDTSPFEGARIFGECTQQQPIRNTTPSGYTFYYMVFKPQDTDHNIYWPNIHLVAPEEYSDLTFKQWQDEDGNPLTLDRDLYLYSVSDNTSVVAVYGEADTLWVNDGVADNYTLFSFLDGSFAPTTVQPGNDANSGLGPNAPKRTLQAMLDDPPIPLKAGVKIFVSKGLYQENIVLGPEHSGITIIGAGAGPAGSVLDGTNTDTCIRADGWQDGTIEGFEIINGSPAGGGGGAIRLANGSQATITRNFIYNNVAEEGGGIAAYSSSVTVLDNVFENNTVTGEGGAMYFAECYPEIMDNDVSGNTATNGGGIRAFLCVGGIDKNWIYGNTAAIQGGGIYAKSCTMHVADNYIGLDRDLQAGPNMAREGGGVYAILSTDAYTNNVVSDNEATLQGGGILLDYFSSCDITHNNITENYAGTNGGGLCVRSSSTARISACHIDDNIAEVAGGGLSFNDSCGGFIRGNNYTVNDNTSLGVGGGIYMANNCTVDIGQELKDVWFYISGNYAATSGGGIYLERGSSSTMVHTYLTSNTADTGNGGGLYMRDGCNPQFGKGSEFGPSIANSNLAGLNGGGIFIGQGCSPNIGTYSPDYLAVEIYGNTAGLLGGGICMLQAPAPSITDASVSGNNAIKGGGIYAGCDTGSVNDTGVDSNTAEDPSDPAEAQGGGIFIPAGSHISIAAGVYNNTATDGGGVYAVGSSASMGATVGSSSVSYNTATAQGGGLHCAGGDMSYWSNVGFDGNDAPVAPGVYVTDSFPTFNGTSSRNHSLSTGAGAGFRFENSTSLFERNVLIWNRAPEGAGLYEENSTLTITGNTFQANTATDAGGGMYITDATVRLGLTTDNNWTHWETADGSAAPVRAEDIPTPNNFVDNAAPIGAGLYIATGNASTVNVGGSRFGENRADSFGAGIYSDHSKPHITTCLFVGNSSDMGAGVYVAGTSGTSTATVRNSTFIGNFAREYLSGGGLYTEPSNTAVANSIFWGNRHDIKGVPSALITYTDMQDSSSGLGNISADPLLAGPGFMEQIQDADRGDNVSDGTNYDAFTYWNDGSCTIQFVTTAAVEENQFAGCWLNPNVQQNRLYYIVGNTANGDGVNGGTDLWVNGWVNNEKETPMSFTVPIVAREGNTFQIWDFHPRSTQGRFSANTPWPADLATSPVINRGDPGDSAANEPVPNGGRVNMGAYGGTTQASESGQVTPGGFQHGVASISSNWTTVTFTEPFPDAPVVVASPATEKSAAPGVVRLRSISRSSFQIRIQPWPYLGSTHGTETVHWMACVKGVWMLGADQQIVADTVRTNNISITRPLTVRFPQSFAAAPAVFGQVQTYDDSHAVAHRIQAVTTTTFRVSMQEQLSSTHKHGLETIGYIAISRDATTIGAQTVAVTVTGSSVTNNPFLIVTPQGQLTIRVSEEASKDKVLTHLGESVAYMTLAGSPPLVADMQTVRGKDPCNLRCVNLADSLQYETGQRNDITASWRTIPLNNTYVSPIVVVGPATNLDKARGTLRVRNVHSNSFQVRFQEWSYNRPLSHGKERMAYLVVERGAWNVDGGRMLLADKFTSSNINVAAPTTIPFSARFSAAPVVVASEQTANGSDAVTERMRSIAASSFRLALQAEPQIKTHRAETVGFVALGAGTNGIEAGAIQITQGTRAPTDFTVLNVSYRTGTHRAETIGYLTIVGLPHNQPYFIASMQTINDRNLSTLRCTPKP